MPIPPRPIPSHAQANRRPGRSVPRKLASTMTNNLDWRAEVALLNELGPGQGQGQGARSLPVSKLSGLQLVDKKSTSAAGQGSEDIGGGRREVQLEGLIAGSKGKREKKATTATTLGFDFIPNPSILALPDTTDACTTPSNPAKSSLLSMTKSSPAPAPLLAHRDEPKPEPPSPALSGTPQTPALLAQASDGEVDQDQDEDDDWEHIPSLSASAAASASKAAGKEEPEDDDDDGDVIVLGELELEEEFDKLDLGRKGAGAVQAKAKGGKASYAAALGSA